MTAASPSSQGGKGQGRRGTSERLLPQPLPETLTHPVPEPQFVLTSKVNSIYRSTDQSQHRSCHIWYSDLLYLLRGWKDASASSNIQQEGWGEPALGSVVACADGADWGIWMESSSNHQPRRFRSTICWILKELTCFSFIGKIWTKQSLKNKIWSSFMLAPQRLSAFLPLPYSINSVQRLLKSKET